MSNQSINALTALQSQIDVITTQFGIDACIAHAESVYSQHFRSEPMRICDCLNSRNLSMEEYYDEFNEIEIELWSSLKSELYTRCTGISCPHFDDDTDCDDPCYDSMAISIGYEQEDWNERRDAWVKGNDLHPESFINEKSEIVFICNYKGESEGEFVMFTDSVANLPVFKSKHESFMI